MTEASYRILLRPGEAVVALIDRPGAGPRLLGTFPSLAAIDLPAAASITLVIPGETVPLHELPLPKRNRRRFLAAVPFALEETLFGDPEEYHFVPLPTAAGSAVLPVAVIERARLAAHGQAIAARGWRLRAVLPDYLLLPVPAAASWLLDWRATPPLLRRPDGGAALPGCEAPDAAPPAPLLLALEAAAQRPEKLILIVADAALAERAGHWHEPLAKVGVALEIRQEATPRAAALVLADAPDERCTLLTGSFAPRREGTAPWRRSRPAAVLACLLLLVVGGRWLLAGLQLTSRHQELTAAIEAEYRALVPEARNLIDPRYQLETELTRLRATQAAQARPRDFLVLLDGVAAALGDDAGLHALTFDATGLRLELDAPNLERLAAIEQRLAAVGAVTRDAARPEGERVRGTVQLAEPAR